MRLLQFVTAFLLVALNGAMGQNLTVHVLDRKSSQPLKNVLVRLHYGCEHPIKPVEVKQKTDTAGVAVFRSASLSPLEFCVFPDLETYATQELPFVFASRKDSAMYSKSLNIEYFALPAEVTFHVRRLTFGERLRNIFDGNS